MPSAESATTDDVDALIGTVLGERYKITRVVGEGGMGRVYEARHLLIGRRVAIKVLKHDIQRHAGFEERLIHEGQLAGTLGHPHIVACLDMGHTSNADRTSSTTTSRARTSRA